jgi:hypothetical protein
VFGNGRWYFFCTDARSWTSAFAACDAAGGNLATAVDATENAFIAERITANSWIGANDRASEGTWLTITTGSAGAGVQFWSGDDGGNPVGGRFNAWKSNQPNAGGSADDCAQLQPADASIMPVIPGVWTDDNCANTVPWICEIRTAGSVSTGGERLESNVVANQDYTVLLKGDEQFAQGKFIIKLYDELGLASGGAGRIAYQTICPNIPPYNSCRPIADVCTSYTQCCSKSCSSGKCTGVDPVGTVACKTTEIASNGFTQSLAPDSYYVTVKGRKANEKGFYELQVGDPINGSAVTKYVPPTWTETRDALVASGAKVLPVLSCPPGGNSGRCAGTEAQAKSLALLSGAVDKSLDAMGVPKNEGLIKYINSDGTGIGSGLALAVRDLASYLSMDISLSVVNNPGFTIEIQKCLSNADLIVNGGPCQALSKGCLDTNPFPKNTVAKCQPGASPKFFVKFTNPLFPNNVKKNSTTNDPFGGYHFKLQIIGNKQFLLDEVPVYIIPTDVTIMPPAPPGAGTFVTSGTYEQEIFGAGCNFELLEGEGTAANSCSDGVDNNGDGLTDKGNDLNMDGDMLDAMEGPDPGCKLGSCSDGINNDGDTKAGVPLTDVADPDCATNKIQDWTDLFYTADLPVGTEVDFDLCTATTAALLATECVGTTGYSRVASVTSSSGSCAINSECIGVSVGGVLKDGFCGKGGQCQFISPQKLGGTCTKDADCANAPGPNGEIPTSTCDTTAKQCRFTTPPADIATNLPAGQNGKPFMKVRITLKADPSASTTPSVFDWYLTYWCRAGI